MSSFLSSVAALALIQTIVESEDLEFTRDVEHRLGLLQLELVDLKEMQKDIDFLVRRGVQETGDYSEQLDLPEEFSAFFSWLLCNRALHGDSHQFDLLVNTNIAQVCGALTLNLADHRLKVVGWVVGRETTGSLSGFPASLPSKAANIPDLASLAFEGLLEHQQFILDSMRGGYNAFENEMSVSSLPIRIAGLAEALVQSGGDSQNLSDVMLIAYQQAKGVFPKTLQSRWSGVDMNSLIQDRNAAAHVWDDGSGRPTLRELIEKLTAEYASSLFELATYMVAGAISKSLKDLELKRVEQWYKAILRKIEQLESW